MAACSPERPSVEEQEGGYPDLLRANFLDLCSCYKHPLSKPTFWNKNLKSIGEIMYASWVWVKINFFSTAYCLETLSQARETENLMCWLIGCASAGHTFTTIRIREMQGLGILSVFANSMKNNSIMRILWPKFMFSIADHYHKQAMYFFTFPIFLAFPD